MSHELLIKNGRVIDPANGVDKKCDVLIADGYKIKDGCISIPDTPGFGLKLNEQKFSSAIKPKFDLKI